MQYCVNSSRKAGSSLKYLNSIYLRVSNSANGRGFPGGRFFISKIDSVRLFSFNINN